MNKKDLNKLKVAKSYHQKGELKKAKSLYQEILLNNPKASEPLHYLGVVYFNRLEFCTALELINKSIKLTDNNPKFYINKGNVLLQLSKYDKAEECFKKAISLDDSLEDAYINLGILYIQTKKFQKGIKFFVSALKLNPNNLKALIGIGRVYSDQDILDKSIQFYNRAIFLDKFNLEAINDRGVVFQKSGDYANALKDYNLLIKIDPQFAIGFNNKGVILKSLNKVNEAKLCFRKAIDLDNHYYEAYKNYFSIPKFDNKDPLINILKLALLKNNLTENDKMCVHLAMVQIEKSLKNYSKVFKHLSSANKIKNNNTDFDIEIHKAHINKIKTFFKRPYFFQNLEINKFKITPIFILGMPRSGTTLIEQVLSSHSKIHGAGELDYLSNILTKVNWGDRSNESDIYTYIRKNYFKQIQLLSNNVFIVDKNPLNYKNIGFIINAIPEAKIIHIKRNPMAVYWSNFLNYFPSKTMGFSFNLEAIGEYYNQYENLMKHWESLYPEKIYHLKYEDFVNDFEIEVKKLISYLNINWENAINEFYENPRVVMTASNMQVRNPIYKGSSEEWKSYKNFLKPAMKILDKYNINY